ncbi:MAG: UDP-N-acetylglucosamine--N-acetylmuramyl-(pentapeptide) pyrophosphoryl-undecaprenol N-acetylglucosamine transferase, partial [Ornithinimicrobium sp.]|uniref:UDP-N-acetylglucosamine--N-acetylmuramyl- (pentapeptide) pyrophosphoryl-undecaprenol N-acetylglucosamine transferase n=1 Tax=Ornithinimicrobium sp. TaxID=1977084 RepID=UPI003D9B2637
VNPLLATADCLHRRDGATAITVLGTAAGLEARLVPERGYPLRTLPKAPFPRRPDARALRFPGALRAAVSTAAEVLRDCDAHVLVGFGGYVSTPAYLAARRLGIPIVIHEQNSRAGLANRLGARFTEHVCTTFAQTSLRHSSQVGLPLRREITDLDRSATRAEALAHFGLDPARSTLLVFGGSLGAQRINAAFAGAGADVLAQGVQVLHLTGADKGVQVPPDRPGAPRYVTLPYTERMELAYAAADLVVARSGAGTVCEIAAVGLPAVFVPLPVGNGEQRLNAADAIEAGAALLTQDSAVGPDWVRECVLPLLADQARLERMGAAAAAIGHRDADEALTDIVLHAAAQA